MSNSPLSACTSAEQLSGCLPDGSAPPAVPQSYQLLLVLQPHFGDAAQLSVSILLPLQYLRVAPSQQPTMVIRPQLETFISSLAESGAPASLATPASWQEPQSPGQVLHHSYGPHTLSPQYVQVPQSVGQLTQDSYL